MQLTHPNVIITGASRGLGLALARALLSEGARVALVARDRSLLEAITAGFRKQGLTAHAFPCDVGSAEAGAHIAGVASALLGDIDMIVHNASTLGPTPLRPLTETTETEFMEVVRVNLLGPFLITKALVGGMVARGRGLIVSISSDAAIEAYPNWGAYSVTKAGLDHLSRMWAAELAGTNVRSISIDPGEMDTAMHAAALPDSNPSSLASPTDVASAILRLIGSDPPSGGRFRAADFLEGGK